jgi:hypothetical protein
VFFEGVVGGGSINGTIGWFVVGGRMMFLVFPCLKNSQCLMCPFRKKNLSMATKAVTIKSLCNKIVIRLSLAKLEKPVEVFKLRFGS